MAQTFGPSGDPTPTPGSSAAADPTDATTRAALERELQPDLEIVRPLADGRSGRVWLAREPGLGRLVAVKVLASELAKDRVARARFEREARAAAALNHPNAVAVHRFGYLASGVPYLVMQYVKGVTLEDKLAAEGLPSVSDARRILAEIADALSAAHRRGFVHRDIRPGNVLCDNEAGRVLVTDFGLAGLLPGLDGPPSRLTQSGEVLALPEYASPEQLEGEPASEASDIYALGILGYQLLAGEGPFRASSISALTGLKLSASPAPLRSLRPDLDAELADLLERCLSREPGKRPRASHVAAALRSGGNGPVGDTGEPSTDLIDDLLRRKLPQIVAVTAVAGYAALNFVDQLADHQVIPELVYRLSLCTFVYSVVTSGVIAWFHGKAGRQRISSLEVGVLGVVATAWVVTCFVLVVT